MTFSTIALKIATRIIIHGIAWMRMEIRSKIIRMYQMPYELNEDDIRQELEILGLPENIVVPTSNKTE